ncbi:prepilin-type N-terminal cleavage/methylation domain-containing protein [Candidatus Saccharibacteria bacterium]|nr:prepilin-type N-terminal cleavage/methylation domain-containing protein [Candidatus Saccharibacteria bacterium]
MRGNVAEQEQGFTIVELLIVIVVVAILATISVVAFRGVQQRATLAALQSDSSAIAKKIELFRVDAALYPASINDCPSPSATTTCVNVDSATTGSYFAFNPSVPPRFGAALHSASPPAYELVVKNDSQFYYYSTAEITHTNEFMQYADMAPLIDEYGMRKYEISFDIKSADTSARNTVNVYMQNGSGSRYQFSTSVSVTTTYERRTVVVTPSGLNNSYTQSLLAFYGVYGTGNRPTVKNVQIRLAQ